MMNADEFSKHLIAIIIGVNEIPDSDLPKLLSPEKDAQRIVEALMLKQGCAVREENILLLTGEEATTAGCLSAIEELQSKCSQEDVLIIYFAGHGLRDETNFYLCTHSTNPEDLSNTALSGSHIDVLLSKTKARGILFIIDCCKSAAFAELSPDFFKQLDNKDFKLLLSASKSGELSWERPKGAGTLFSQHLIETIEGKRIISDTPGLIYFSELLHFIQDQLKEDFEAEYKDLPVQQPVFTGTYSMDPLLFVHRGLTLKQVKVKTKRYSKEYIKRLLIRSIAWTLGSLLVLSGLTYTVLDNLEFISLEQNKIVRYAGIPGLQIFGFPKRIWEYNYSSGNLSKSSRLLSQPTISGKLGENGDALIYRELGTVEQADHLIRMENADSARHLLYGLLLNNKDASADDKFFALQTIHKIREPADTTLFNIYLNDPDDKVRALAIIGTFAYNSAKAADMAIKDPSLVATGIMIANDLPNRVVSNVNRCDEAVKHYFGFLSNTFYNYTKRLALLSAYRNRCDLDDSCWINIFKNVGGDDWDDDLTNFCLLQDSAQIKRIENIVSDRLMTSNHLSKKYILKLLHALPDGSIDNSYVDQLNVENSDVQYFGLALYLKRPSSGIEPKRIIPLKRNPRCTALLAKYRLESMGKLVAVFSSSTFSERADILDELFSFSKVQIDSVYNDFLSLVLDPKTYYTEKRRLIELFHFFRFPSDTARGLLNHGDLAIRSAAYVWYYEDHKKEAEKTLLNTIDEDNEAFAFDILVNKQLGKESLTIIRNKVKNSVNPGEFMSALLAIFGDENDLGFLLRNPDAAIRNLATVNSVANPNIEKFLRSIPAEQFITNQNLFDVRSQYTLANKIVDELRSTPKTLRLWQLEQLKNSWDFAADGSSLTYGMVRYIKSCMQ